VAAIHVVATGRLTRGVASYATAIFVRAISAPVMCAPAARGRLVLVGRQVQVDVRGRSRGRELCGSARRRPAQGRTRRGPGLAVLVWQGPVDLACLVDLVPVDPAPLDLA
jgi:hypothetical protein